MKFNIKEYLIKKNIKFIEYDNWVNICNPFITDTKYHLGINKFTGYCNCFKSQMKFSFPEFVSKYEKCSLQEAYKILNINQSDTHPLYELKERFSLLNEQNKEYEIKLPYSSVPLRYNSRTYKYIYSRLKDHTLIKKLKLYENINNKRWNNYLIIPYWEDNKIVYYVGRNILNDKRPRYLYLKYKKSQFVYNIENCDTDTLYVCEGQLNAAIVNGVGIGGSSISEKQIEKILSKKPKKLVIALDQDKEIIRKKCMLIAKKFREFRSNVYFYRTPFITKLDFVDMGQMMALQTLQKCTYAATDANIIKFL